MRTKIFKRGEGKYDLLVRRSRVTYLPAVAKGGLTKEEIQTEVAKLIGEERAARDALAASRL